MTKSLDSLKPPCKLETVILKVFIHCEGCRRKVKKIINGLDGVESVTIDSESGKVTVTGTVDSKTLIDKLQKSRKHAELWTNSPVGGGKSGNNQNQTKASNNNSSSSSNKSNKGNNNSSDDNNDKSSNDNKNKGSQEKSKEGEAGGENKASTGGNNGGGETNNVAGNNTGGGKKGNKKDGGGDATTMMNIDEPTNNIGITNKNMSAFSVQTGYSLQSAEYATHMFSDENANNCQIM